MARYRYILYGLVTPESKLNEFRLIASNKIGQSISSIDAIRVKITDDIKLEKLSCDGYSTTDCEKTLAELECDVVAKINGRWHTLNLPIGARVCDYLYRKGFRPTLKDESRGYISSQHML